MKITGFQPIQANIVHATDVFESVAINYQRYLVEPIPSGLVLTDTDRAMITASQILEVLSAINFIGVVEETTDNLLV